MISVPINMLQSPMILIITSAGAAVVIIIAIYVFYRLVNDEKLQSPNLLDIDQNQKYQPWCPGWATVTSRASQRKLRLRAKIRNTMFKHNFRNNPTKTQNIEPIAKNKMLIQSN